MELRAAEHVVPLVEKKSEYNWSSCNFYLSPEYRMHEHSTEVKKKWWKGNL